MVESQLAARGIRDDRVLRAMGSLPREAFVPEAERVEAYEDHPLPIGQGQTISQPYVVALMAEAAEVASDDVVLEIGTGSGYGAAVLGRLAGEVHTVERHRPLADGARRALDEVGATNVHVHVGDGTEGWPQRAPFDAIVVTAAAAEVPRRLVDQLADGGRLVIPVGPEGGVQELLRLRRRGTEVERESLGPVRFVPLVPGSGAADDGVI